MTSRERHDVELASTLFIASHPRPLSSYWLLVVSEEFYWLSARIIEYLCRQSRVYRNIFVPTLFILGRIHPLLQRRYALLSLEKF